MKKVLIEGIPECIFGNYPKQTAQFAVFAYKRLEREVKRLKAGRFTPEEFQNLCHTFSAEDKHKFFDGCAEYQRQLFGVADRDECCAIHPVDKESSKQ